VRICASTACVHRNADFRLTAIVASKSASVRSSVVTRLSCVLASVKYQPNYVEAHYNLANLYYDAGDFPLARLHYEAATQIEPNFSLVYYNLALVYHRLNNVPAATQSLNRYKELEPSDEEIELVDQLLKAMETGRPGN
jgi:tetratricopeptide (TPR) repeat protein